MGHDSYIYIYIYIYIHMLHKKSGIGGKSALLLERIELITRIPEYP